MGGRVSHGDAWWNSHAVCPFYGRTRAQYREIVCEAVVSQAWTSVLRFRNSKSMEEYLYAFCSDMEKCADCPNHRMAAEKYDKHGKLKEGK